MNAISVSALCRTAVIMGGLILMGQRMCVAGEEVTTWATANTELKANYRTGVVEGLRHLPLGHSWAQRPFTLFKVAGGKNLETKMEARATAEGILLTLRIINRSHEPQKVTPTFPDLTLSGSDQEDHRQLQYCFPARVSLVGRGNVSDRAYYSGIAPLQFLAVDHPTRGSLHAIVCDTKNTRKLFGIDKTDDRLRLFVEHEARTLAGGEEWVLPPVLIATTGGTWHDGLAAYRRWLATWYRPAAPRSAEFRKVFNFRVFYPHHEPPMRSDIYNPEDKSWSMIKGVDRDKELFGGVDFVHLFGWSKTQAQGRVGDYAPWAHMGGLPNFRKQLEGLHKRGIPTGLYLEGYLASPQSEIVKKHGKEWAMLDAKGKRVDTWGGGYTTMCPHMPGWQDYLAKTCKRLSEETGAKGAYIDQFGFLTQYRCFNPAHAKHHSMGSHMLAGEAEMLRKIRKSVGTNMVLYTEEVPTDYITQFTDGAYTASVKIALSRGIKCPINLTRFALPGFKTIELISEHGIGDHLPAVRATFFNGEGIYLSGDDSLFTPACMKLIKKTHAILRKHAEAFTSMEPTPLVSTLAPTVYANRFPAKRSVVWTLMQTGSHPHVGPVLTVPHRKGARYWDEWNGCDLMPEIRDDGHAVLTLSMAAGDAGCIVQSW